MLKGVFYSLLFFPFEMYGYFTNGLFQLKMKVECLMLNAIFLASLESEFTIVVI